MDRRFKLVQAEGEALLKWVYRYMVHSIAYCGNYAVLPQILRVLRKLLQLLWALHELLRVLREPS